MDIEWIVGTILNEVFVINYNCIIVQHILHTVAIEKVQKNIHFSEHVINSPNNPSNRMDCYANGKINALNAFSHQLHIRGRQIFQGTIVTTIFNRSYPKGK